jgi:hypothetical protein
MIDKQGEKDEQETYELDLQLHADLLVGDLLAVILSRLAVLLRHGYLDGAVLGLVDRNLGLLGLVSYAGE